MTPTTTTEQVQAQAARWYARLHAPDCTTAEREAFQHWLRADARHHQAYKKAVQVAILLATQLGSDEHMQALVADAAKPATHPKTAWQRVVSAGRQQWATAAMLLFSAIVLGLASVEWAQRHDQSASRVVRYSNPGVSEQTIKLQDGSVVFLDAASELEVALSSTRRELQLRKGRALFEVAHDKSRPFVVTALGTDTVALGTRFQVDVCEQHVLVTLAQGSIAVAPSTSATAVGTGWREVLKPGEQLSVDVAHAERVKSLVNAGNALGWSQGKLVFDGATLADALQQVNRYNTLKVVLGDQTLNDTLIGGSYVVGTDVTEFVDALTTVLPLTSIRSAANEIVLFQSHKDDSP